MGTKYRPLNPICSTRNSTVYVISVCGTCDRQAMKVIHHSIMPRSRFENECAVQSLVHHPYVMPLTESFDCDGFRAMVMPRASGGCLLNLVNSGKLPNPVSVGRLLYRLFKGVAYLHSRGILHGDIKPANVVLMNSDIDDPHPAIIDFGHAADLSAGGECNCQLMTCAFSAPDVLGLGAHSLPSDIWALAATVYFVVTGSELLTTTHLDVMCHVARGLRVRFSSQAWAKYPESMQAMLARMLRPEPADRIRIQECLAHPCFVDLLGSEWLGSEDESLKQGAHTVAREDAIANQ
jgi:serine/threonine protein kinase